METDKFIFINKDAVIIPVDKFVDGGDVHETLIIDKIGEIVRGHTTIRLPGGVDTNVDHE